MIGSKKIILIILDGWGFRPEVEYNAIAKATTPFFDFLSSHYPQGLLMASGEYVGLPVGQMGNSEVGHMTIGAGRIIDTDLIRISKAIEKNDFATNQSFQILFDHVRRYNSTLHIQGLIGPGGIHSHSEHLFAFLRAAKEAGLNKIAIDVFTDGRDTPPQSAAKYLQELETIIEDLGIGFIATASGRFYAMDRDNNWDRLARAEKAIFDCQGNICRQRKPSEVMAELYRNGVLDEHLEPVVFLDDKNDAYPIRQNDGVFFFNFRADRARMLSKKITEKIKELNLCFVTMTEYDRTLDCLVAFPPQIIETTLAKEISLAGLRQAHIAETEKFAHATYFLNGGVEQPYPYERHILVDSRKDISTYDQAPEMRAKEIVDEAIKQIEAQTDFIFVNFANPDMVGHTANWEALIKAVEAVDCQLKRLLNKALANGITAIVTADHGNAELAFDSQTGIKHTAHTINPVPIILTDKNYRIRDGALMDVAPTVLELFGLKIPDFMTGRPLHYN